MVKKQLEEYEDEPVSFSGISVFFISFLVFVLGFSIMGLIANVQRIDELKHLGEIMCNEKGYAFDLSNSNLVSGAELKFVCKEDRQTPLEDGYLVLKKESDG